MKEEKTEKLKELREAMFKDMTLPLREKATNLVFGEGNPDAQIFFLGEGPGYWEDVKGRPFVGNAGALLNQLLQTIEVERKDVFITNVVCFRPPNNRDPLPSEIDAFKPYIDKIIEIVNPRVIVTLGRFSMSKFLLGVKITTVHGKVFDIKLNDKEKIIIPMYHPAAALRRNEIMLELKEDFKRIPQILKETKQKIDVEQTSFI